jgi:hypothetical protein
VNERYHALVTRTAPAAGAVDDEGLVNGTVAHRAVQSAADEVYAALQQLGFPFNKDLVVVDVRVTAFVPYAQ